jgi:putative transposase
MILVYRYRVKSLNGLLDRQSRACNFVGKRSLGWVPIKGRELKREGDAFRFAGNTFRVFNSRPLPEGKIRDRSNFSCDTRGHWYLNIVIDVVTPDRSARRPLRSVGIDLGLKDFATLSTGEKIEAQRIYRGAEQALALAQRAHKKRRVRAIHAKIANRRSDFLHKLSDRIVRQFDYIAIGNVTAARLARTSMAIRCSDVRAGRLPATSAPATSSRATHRPTR